MPDIESQGSKPRDHHHPRHHGPRRRPHKDWRVWAVVGLMLALVLVYVATVDNSIFRGHRVRSPTPAVGAP